MTPHFTPPPLNKGEVANLKGKDLFTGVFNIFASNQNLSDKELARLKPLSKTIDTLATRQQMGNSFHKVAKHYDARRGEVVITADDMLEIALNAFRTVIRLKGTKKPVILYRVFDRKRLTKGEEEAQTVAGAARITGKENLWPIERTAAWIQGALRARSTFLLLSDPRDDNVLVGGKDKNSDAVYVREIYQILMTKWEIALAPESSLPSKTKGTFKGFMLQPPASEIGPMPLTPRMSEKMDYNHTWDGSKSTLSVNGDAMRIRDVLIREFTTAGTRLQIPKYSTQ